MGLFNMAGNRHWANTDSALWKCSQCLVNIRTVSWEKNEEECKRKWNNTWHGISKGFAHRAFSSTPGWTRVQRAAGCFKSCGLKAVLRHNARFRDASERWKLTLDATFNFDFIYNSQQRAEMSRTRATFQHSEQAFFLRCCKYQTTRAGMSNRVSIHRSN